MNEHQTSAENAASTRETPHNETAAISEVARVLAASNDESAQIRDAEVSLSAPASSSASTSENARVLAASKRADAPLDAATSGFAAPNPISATSENSSVSARVLAANTAQAQQFDGEVVQSEVAQSDGSRVLASKAKAQDDEIVPIHDWIYWTMTALFRIFFRLGGWRVHGRRNVPRRGGVILAANHISYFDPPLMGCASPRRVTTMGKSELFEIKPFGLNIFPYIIQHMATFPVKRGTPDRRAMRRATQVLKSGEALVIFPEGKRTESGQIERGELGVAMIAHKAKVPIVPVYLKGTDQSLSPMPHGQGIKFFKTEVFYGAPLFFQEEYARKADRVTLQGISDRVMQEIAALKKADESKR